MKKIRFCYQITILCLFSLISQALYAEANPLALLSKSVLKATVTDLNNGQWKVSYQLDRPQSALIFSRSIGDYRASDWRSLIKGVGIKRVGGFDAIISDQARKDFSFTFTPSELQLNGDYTPFIKFSDGGVALFTGQFELLPIKNETAIKALNGNLHNYVGRQYNCEVLIKSEKPKIFKGQVYFDSVVDRFFGGGEYVFVGNSKITRGKSFIGVLDSDLPDWVTNRFDSDLESIFNGLNLLFSRDLPHTPTVLFAFHGLEKLGISNAGGAIGNGLLVLESEGSLYKKQNERAHSYLLWFFAHEAAHLYQHKNSYYLHQLPDRWIYEGGANAIANYLLDDQSLTAQKTLSERKADAVNKCVKYLDSGKLIAQAVYHPSRAHYYCGEVFSYITDAALPNHSYFDFWDALVSQEVDQENTPTGTELYFKTMAELGASEDVINSLSLLVVGKTKSPKKRLLKTINDVGMVYTTNQKGELVSLLLP